MKSLIYTRRKFLLALLFCGIGVIAFGLTRLNWHVSAAGQDNLVGSKSSDGLWQEVTETAEMRRQAGQSKPQSYRTLRLDQEAMLRLLKQAPMEFTAAAKQTAVTITIPLPDGKFGRFELVESPVMAPELAAQFPEIKTYSGQGVDDLTATARVDWTPAGFHAMIMSSDGSVYVDPYAQGDTANYISYYKHDYQKEGENFRCLVTDEMSQNSSRTLAPSVVPSHGATLRTYRLALAATVEYTQAAGGTVPLAMARMTTTMNRVNGIYEREIAVRMVMIANNNALIYTAEPDPYTNNSGSAMLGQNQTNVDTVIGTNNYDIGHVFSTGGGGIATLNSPCDTSTKARGVTGSSNPTGDSFDVDLVAHEIGHQFGADHTFNDGVTDNCTNRSASAAYEPASGSTIMAYANICAPQNLQRSSDAYFHVKSLEQMISHLTGAGNCASQTATGNTPPVVNAGANFTIPRNTPFTLTATATDANGDALTYDWEEYDLGPAAPPNNDADGNARPIFRSYVPVANGSRTFPSLPYILNNANVPPATYTCGTQACVTGEILPAIGRTMNFQATVRDNRANGGGVHSGIMQVTVASNTGPFQVTAPNTAISWTGGSQQTITWAVNGTNVAPISTANVKILLSTDGGNTFPTVVLASTPNDGSENITVPAANSTMARIKVEAIGNIFFDVSDQNFTITTTCSQITINPASLPNGAVNAAYSQTLTVSGGTAPYSFTLDAGSLAASRFNASGPVNIPDNNPAGVELPVTVSGVGAPIAKVTVSLHISHTYDQDLRLQLIGPDATTVDLAVNLGPNGMGYGNNCSPDNSRTTFDDAAATAITSGTPPFVGTFRPAQLLSAFNGKSGAAVNGQWKLKVIDNASGDTGAINCVSILITPSQPAPGLSLASNGTLSGTPTAAGTYNFTANVTDNANCMGTRAYTLVIGAGQCPTLTPASRNFSMAATSSNVVVTANCAWSATSNAAWLTLTGTTSGTSDATVTYDVAANTGASRTGTITVNGQTHTVFQATSNTTQDSDNDGIPDSVEITENRNPLVKDNDIYENTATGRRLFVMQQYRDFLGREGDAPGIQGWVDLLTNNTLTRAQVIQSFFNSPEFQQFGAPIVRLYLAYFRRIPDYAGQIGWTNALRNGTSLDAISQTFATSPEFILTYGSLNNPQFVTLVYQNVLNRTPSQAEIDAWVALLNQGAPRGQVMTGFSESQEFKLQSANKVFVIMMYVGMLRREPEQAGYDGWVALLNGGTSQLVLTQSFLDAPEYRLRFLP